MNNFDTFEIRELKLTTLSGAVADLREQLVELNVFTSIYESTVSAQLLVHDSFNFIENAPILGGEKISFKWRTAGRSAYSTYSFRIYKIGKRTTSEATQGYVLYLASDDAYNDANTEVSYAFTGEYSSCIPQVLSHIESKRPINVDVTTGAVNKALLTPNWTPLTICRFMASRAMDEDSNPVLFYENEDGYQFKTVRTMYDQPAWSTFVYENQDTFEYDQERNFHNIASFTIKPSRNTMNASADGIYGTELSTYDFGSKSIEVSHHSYSDVNVPTVDSAKVEFDTEAERTYRRFIETQFDGCHQGDFNRRVVMNLMGNFTITAVMVGDSAMRVGSIINFDVPATEPLNNGVKQYEQRNSGRFLIAAMKLMFTRQQVTAGVEICKDSQKR